MLKSILAAMLVLFMGVEAHAQWMGQARQTAVLTNGLTAITGSRSNVQQVIEWVNSNWPTNISVTNAYATVPSLTNYWSSSSQSVYSLSVSNQIQLLSNQVVSVAANRVKGTNISGAVAFTNDTWVLKTPKYFFEAYQSNSVVSGNSNTWYTLADYTTQAQVSGGPFSISTGIYTAPKDGWYLFNSGITRIQRMMISNVGFRAAISINSNTNFINIPFLGTQIGADIFGMTTNQDVVNTYNGVYVTRLLANDAVSVLYLSSVDLATNNYIANGYFSGLMIQEQGYDQ
jgi:hypothetical protein